MTGVDTKQEIMTRETNSTDNIFHNVAVDAPSIFRIPISFLRCSATNEDNPKSPKQLINIASAAKK